MRVCSIGDVIWLFIFNLDWNIPTGNTNSSNFIFLKIEKAKNRREQLTIKQPHNIHASNILLVKLTIAQISNNPVFVWCLRMPSGYNKFRAAITLLIRQSCISTYFPCSLLLSLVHEYILIWWFSHIRSIMELVIQD